MLGIGSYFFLKMCEVVYGIRICYYESKVHFYSKVAMRPELVQVPHYVNFLSHRGNNKCSHALRACLL